MSRIVAPVRALAPAGMILLGYCPETEVSAVHSTKSAAADSKRDLEPNSEPADVTFCASKLARSEKLPNSPAISGMPELRGTGCETDRFFRAPHSAWRVCGRDAGR